jgi:DNA-binding response OmpR family regulator
VLQQKGELSEQAEYFMKPMMPRELLKKVREVLDRA